MKYTEDMGFFGTKRRVYADAAAATPLEPEVRARLLALLDIYGNPGALHREGAEAKRELDGARKEAAEAIGAHADEIIFTASGTEANNLAISGTFAAHGKGHAITLAVEHPSVLEPFAEAERQGAHVTVLPVGEDGLVDIKAIVASITEDTLLVSVALINSETGVMQDMRAIAKAVRDARARRSEGGKPLYLHIDASQAPYWVRLHTDALHADLMTLDAQKCGGPKGVGLLYVRRGTRVAPQMRGGGQEQGLRAGTENVPLAGAFARALMLAQKHCDANSTHVKALRNELLEALVRQVPGVRVNGSRDFRVPNNLNVSIPGLPGEMAVIALSERGVAASTRSACSEGDEEASHVLFALGLSKDLAQSALRFTLLPSATAADIRRIAEALVHVCMRYRTPR